MHRQRETPLRSATVIADTALAELPWWSRKIALLLLAYGIADATLHDASERGWRLATTLGPAALVGALSLATDGGHIGTRRAEWASVVAVVVIECAVIASAHWSTSPADLGVLCVLMVVSGAIAMEGRRYAVMLVALGLGLVVAALSLASVGETRIAAEWGTTLVAAWAASMIVHRTRTHALILMARAQDDIENKATHDVMTGTYTRLGLSIALPLLRAQAARESESVFALFMDVDGLKRINDTLGHAAGDQMIVTAANALQEAVRGNDVVVRWGGDEFVVVGVGEPPSVARLEEQIGARMREGLPDAAQRIAGVSLGAASDRADRVDVDELIRRADAVMYDRRRVRRGNATRAP